MPESPSDWGAVCVLVFLLGMRHGLDADQLAAIDVLTRVGARRQQMHSRYCGALFSLGHGVVLSVALLAGLLGAKWALPGWLEVLGGAISIGFLSVIGAAHLRAVLLAPVAVQVRVRGLRGWFAERLLGSAERRSGPGAVVSMGAPFALSFAP